MKKKFGVFLLCMALLSSFTVFASAEFSSSDSATLSNIYNQLTAVRDQLGYPTGGYSSLRAAINYIADHLPSSPKDYSSVLSNIYSNTSSLASAVEAIKGDTNNISHRSTDILNKLADISTNIGTAQIAITNHLDSFASQNHTDITDFSKYFLSEQGTSSESSSDFPLFIGKNKAGQPRYANFNKAFGLLVTGLVSEEGNAFYKPTLYHMVHQMQQVLASDDDLKLKQDNKANEDAATDSFVNGSSSKTSLGTSDIGNLKDVGGTFNDLTSLNGQSSVTSFLNGLTSADGTGQGWFSEATRASLDAVSAPVTTTRLVQKTWRGEKSIVATVSEDSVNSVSSPSPVSDSDPYNMSGFEDNYNWLWGDAS